MLSKEYFDNYIFLGSQIRRIKKRLKHYRKLTKNNVVHGVVTGSMDQFPFAEKYFVISGPDVKIKSHIEREQKMNELLVRLKTNEQLYEDMQLEIENFLEGPLLEQDLEMKQILQMKFVDHIRDGEIAEQMHYDRRTIGKKIDRFFSRVDEKQKA